LYRVLFYPGVAEKMKGVIPLVETVLLDIKFVRSAGVSGFIGKNRILARAVARFLMD